MDLHRQGRLSLSCRLFLVNEQLQSAETKSFRKVLGILTADVLPRALKVIGKDPVAVDHIGQNSITEVMV